MSGHIWSVLCSRAINDRRTNNISLIDVIEELTIEGGTPVFDGKSTVMLGGIELYLVSLWMDDHLSESPPVCRLSVVTPDKKTLKQPEVPLNFDGNARLRHTFSFQGIPYRGLGRYWWVVQRKRVTKTERVRWEKVARLPLELKASNIDTLPKKAGASPSPNRGGGRAKK